METTITIPPIPSASNSSASTSSNHFIRLLGTNELVFLELQGSIARLDEAEKRLGRLVQEDDGRIYLTVGYQRMEGKVVPLKTPFAVLRKKPTDADKMQVDDEEYDEDDQQPGRVVEMEIVDVCRKKIYFGRRPEPMNEMDEDRSGLAMDEQLT